MAFCGASHGNSGLCVVSTAWTNRPVAPWPIAAPVIGMNLAKK